MANSPTLWGGNNTSTNLQNRMLMANGHVLAFNGAKNYLGYNNFENNSTTGWSIGVTGTIVNGLPTTTPTFGGGGASGTLSISTTSTNPIAGTYSLVFADSSVMVIGNMMASSAITLDIADQAKVLGFSFSYKAAAGTNVSGNSANTYAVAIYDVTNSVWLPTAGQFSMIQSTGVGTCSGTVQTGATTATIRFVIYVANPTGGAASNMFDQFYLGPQTSPPMAPAMSDWTSWTPTGSWVDANHTFTGWWKRVGDSLSMVVKCALTGAPTSASLTITLPNGYTIDTSKIPGTPTNQVLGVLTGQGAAHTFSGVVLYGSTTTVGAFYTLDGSTASIMSYAAITQAAPYTFATGDFIYMQIDGVPISGWSSNSVASSDTDTRVVGLSANVPTSGSITAGAWANITTYTGTPTDTHGAFSASTGVYTVVVTGWYSVQGSVEIIGTGVSAGAEGIRIMVNGSAVAANAPRMTASTSAAIPYSASTTAYITAGGTINLQRYSDRTTPTYTTNATAPVLSITRVSGPATITATESVNARYFASSTTPGTSATPLAITYTTKDYDSHNAYSAGTYTIPVSGKYELNAFLLQTASTTAASQAVVIQILKNGTQTSGTEVWFLSSTAKPITSMVTDQLSCNAGDTITIKAGNDGTTPAVTASNFANYFTIARVGN